MPYTSIVMNYCVNIGYNFTSNMNKMKPFLFNQLPKLNPMTSARSEIKENKAIARIFDKKDCRGSEKNYSVDMNKCVKLDEFDFTIKVTSKPE
jgi:hypothetical protein